MKTLITLIFALTFSSIIQSQIQYCDCKTDLDFLVTKMKEMPSYKHQIIKKRKEREFNQQYQIFADQMETPTSKIKRFNYLNKMMATVVDLHASVGSNSEGISKEILNDTSALQTYLNSEEFINHPRTLHDLALLRKELAQKPITEIEGIYKSEGLTIGVYESDSAQKYEAVVLESELLTWNPGQIVMYLTPNGNDRFNLLYFSRDSKKIQFSKGVSASNGRILYYVKEGVVSNEINFSKEKWVFEQLSDTVQYIYFGEFSNTNSVKKTSKEFYAKMKDSINAKHLIIDLRNNGGGNKKNSDPFLKLFKKNKGNIYVLTNSFSASNTEQFTVKLKKLSNVIHLGETTRGVIAYGMNYGYTYETPSGLFSILPTDMDFHKTYFEYEGKGIVPTVKLNFDSDWISQTIEYIEKQANL
ncbi:MAG: hypothetical protein JKY22_05045 [Flavobacteriaceae bacterium]|nr:hypothetical protein [Flavobacteriaceae bacterium]